VPKSNFAKKACDAERKSELQRMNEALREKRLLWLARLKEETVPENQANRQPE
jgi:hypothetical protein